MDAWTLSKVAKDEVNLILRESRRRWSLEGSGCLLCLFLWRIEEEDER